MRCPIETQDSAELLLDYCARKLDPARTALLDRHMESCGECRAFRDGQRALWQALDQWESLPVSAEFDRQLYRRIEEGKRASWWERTLRPLLLRPALPIAATTCLLLVAGLVLQNSPPAPIEPQHAREIEQVERTLEDLEMLRTFDLSAHADDSSRTM